MIFFLIYMLHCLFAGSYECRNYEEIADTWRSVNEKSNDWRKKKCDAGRIKFNRWTRFVAVGNEMVPLYPPQTRRCLTDAQGWQNYNQPTTLYQTTTGAICFR